MANIRQLRNERKKQLENKPLEFKAVLGRADGTVKVDESSVYVTLYNGDVTTVHNERLPRIPLRKIIVGYDDSAPGLLQVLRFDNVYDTQSGPMVANHKESHAWYSYDPIEVYAEQFLPLLPRAIGGQTVRVYGGWYISNGVFHVLSTRDIDMSAEMPTSGAEWVNAELDDAGVVIFNHGANKASREILLPEEIPTTSNTRKLLYSAKMYVGLTNFVQTRTNSDILDPRFTGISSGGTASKIDWDDVLNVPTEFNPDLTVTDAVYPRKWYKSAAPTVDDDITTGFSKSDVWIDQSNGDAYICIDNADGAADWLLAGSGSGDYSFSVDGRLAVATNVPNAFIVTKDVEISACYIYCKSPGTAGSTIVDINKNGTTIFTTSGNRPTLAFDDAVGWASSVPDILIFTEGDIITLDIDQIAIGAADLVVALSVKGAGSGSGGLGLTVTDGSTTVSNVGLITVDGANLADEGGGEARITILTPTPKFYDYGTSASAGVEQSADSMKFVFGHIIIPANSQVEITNLPFTNIDSYVVFGQEGRTWFHGATGWALGSAYNTSSSSCKITNTGDSALTINWYAIGY
jgi:hypothetical protein